MRKDRSHGHGKPLVFEDVEADGARLGADVWMPDASKELDFWWTEGVAVRDGDVQSEATVSVGRVRRAENLPVQVHEISFVRYTQRN